MKNDILHCLFLLVFNFVFTGPMRNVCRHVGGRVSSIGCSRRGREGLVLRKGCRIPIGDMTENIMKNVIQKKENEVSKRSIKMVDVYTEIWISN